MNSAAPVDPLFLAISAELAEADLADAIVEIFLATPQVWHLRLFVRNRRFDARCNPRDGLCCREITPGRERDFTSPDMPPNFHAPVHLRTEALRRIKYALQHPEYEVAQPPVI